MNEHREKTPQTGSEPAEEFVAFFKAAPRKQSVLNLGCGNGRDALMAARMGHRVRAVDSACSGIEELREQAALENLELECDIVADIAHFDTSRAYDAIILDRLLHRLPDDEHRLTLLDKTHRFLAPGGHILITHTPSTHDLIHDFFAGPGWRLTLTKGDLLVAHLLEGGVV